MRYLVEMRCLGKQSCTMEVGAMSLGLIRSCSDASMGAAMQRTFNVTVNCTYGSAPYLLLQSLLLLLMLLVGLLLQSNPAAASAASLLR